MTDRRRKKAASMTLILADFTVVPLVCPLCVSSVLLFEEELDAGAEPRGAATSQKDLAIKAGASTSGFKIVKLSNFVSMDNNSLQ